MIRLFFILIISLGCLPGNAQMIKIEGLVKDTVGRPLSDVSIQVKGQPHLATTTSRQGTFALQIPDGTKAWVLLFSAVGFQTQEVGMGSGGKNTDISEPFRINVVLRRGLVQLGDIVVTALGRSQSKKEVTGAVSSIDAKDLKNIPLVSVDQAMQGRMAGVNIVQSGKPGGGFNINIRGANSIQSGGQPLYVVDGIPVNASGDAPVVAGTGNEINPLAALNPADVASISVLKDASAAAMYGSNAANGVVLITTKRGGFQKTKIEFGVLSGLQRVAKKLPVLSSPEYVKLIQEEVKNADMPPGPGGPANPRPSNFGLTGLDNAPETYTSTTDWQDAIFRTALFQQYNLALSGGNEKTQFRISGSYTNQDGILVNNNFKQYTFRVNLDNNVSTRFQLSSNINAGYSSYNMVNSSGVGAISSALTLSPTVPVYNPDGSYGVDKNMIRMGSYNPVAEAYNPLNTADNVKVAANVSGYYSLSRNIKITSRWGVDYNARSGNQFYPITTLYGARTNGFGAASQMKILLLTNTNFIEFRKRMNQHAIAFTAGNEVKVNQIKNLNATSINFPSDKFTSLNAGAVANTISARTKQCQSGYFANADYVFQERYQINASIRYDGSSLFGTNNRWGLFPAVSAGWTVLKPKFNNKRRFVDFLKIRGGYGITGNQNFPSSNVAGNLYYAPLFGSYLGEKAIQTYQMGNPDVKWEATEQTNLGMDAYFLNNRVNITMDVYQRNTNNALLNRRLPGSTGYQFVLDNIGAIRNQGIEVAVQTQNIQKRNFSWATMFNISFQKNVVARLNSAGFRPYIGSNEEMAINQTSWVEEGQPIGSFKGYKVKGIFKNADEIAAAPFQSPQTKPGDIQFEDVNKDGVIDSKDQALLGKASPDFYGGLTNTLRYKNFELTIVFNYSYGNKIFNATRQTTEGMSGAGEQTTGVKNRWTADNPNTDMPRAVYFDPNQNGRVSDRWIEDGSFIRLRTLTLSYRFDRSILAKARLGEASVYVSGGNLLTWTKYSGYDPEINTDDVNGNVVAGVDYLNAPQPRTCSLGLRLAF